MKNFNSRNLIVLALVLLFGAQAAIAAQPFVPPFYSKAAREHQVAFTANYRTAETDVLAFAKFSTAQEDSFVRNEIRPLLKYLFGPSTQHSLGNPQRNSVITVDWTKAVLVNGLVELPYTVTGSWILRKDVAAQSTFTMPVPLNGEVVFTPGWLLCTDKDPAHQTRDFFWYFWDPARKGCDHKEGVQYRNITFTVGLETPNQTVSYPEYDKLLQSDGIKDNLQMTFAYGYVEDVTGTPSPETDTDPGMYQYRKFVKGVKALLQNNTTFTDSPILQKEYPNAYYPELVIGHRFQGVRKGVKVTINVVTAAGIDQMDLFAKSFAHDHDGVFGWLGHSRVGSGFDATRFGQIVAADPSYYSISPNYQLIYWGGCNSYAYYTLPFFKFKADASNGLDPKGTKGLDILANGMPSFFSLNATNALAILNPMLTWETRTSYQTIVNSIEDIAAKQGGIYVLSTVLGDEDNQ